MTEMVLVPREPTEEMVAAGIDCLRRTGIETPSSIYRAMIAASPSASVGEGWQPIETAPKDGTQVLAWCVHPFRRYGGEGYEGPVIAHWTDHNDGGWTWYGLTGQFTHWMPLPLPPALLSPGDAG